MKYDMERTETKENFKPFKITIEIETFAEYVHFHDKVAGEITGGSHMFIGDVYNMGQGIHDKACGEI